MTKLEILEVLCKMLKDWKTSLEIDINPDCVYGFCHWLEMYAPNEKMEVLIELKKDLFYTDVYWYDTFYYSQTKQSLISRIDHLNRTIARLEEELKQEQNGTL